MKLLCIFTAVALYAAAVRKVGQMLRASALRERDEMVDRCPCGCALAAGGLCPMCDAEALFEVSGEPLASSQSGPYTRSSFPGSAVPGR